MFPMIILMTAPKTKPPPLASAPSAPPPVLTARVLLLQSVRVALHLGVSLALTFRSAHIGAALHPFERALANEWIHLLFYVDTTMRVRTYDSVDSPDVDVAVTLPNFLLESEEEIAANLGDEFFAGGFAARASSYPVGMLFTIDETRKHLHGAIDNYRQLADVALDKLIVAGDASGEPIAFPELTVWTSWDGDSVPHKYRLTGKNESEWPAPLRLEHANATETRTFFDLLDGMELRFMVGMRQNDSSPNHTERLFQWWIRFTYDLLSQGHLEVSLNFGLQPLVDPNDSTDLSARALPLERKQIPAVFFDESTVFDWCLLGLIGVYQSVEFSLKWWHSQTAVALLSPRSNRLYRVRVWRSFQREARDFWFWGILVLNIATMTCLWVTWVHAYRLYLWDALCLAFASCCALHWVSLVRYLSAHNTRFHILGLTLQRGLPRVAQFLVGVLPIFVGYVLFGTVMFGAKVPRFQSPGATATTLFAIANGDEIHDTFNDAAFTPWVGQIYVYSYLILFSYVVLMVCIGIIEDAFFSAVFPASWPSLHQTEVAQANRRGAEQRDEPWE